MGALHILQIKSWTGGFSSARQCRGVMVTRVDSNWPYEY